jgi:diphosphomevalonate decarboxylase
MNQSNESFVPNWSGSLSDGSAAWKSPSNIALVKYWGKHGIQLPNNPSVSFTLSNCNTQTSLQWSPKAGVEAKRTFLFEGEENVGFGQKSFSFIQKIADYAPWLTELDLTIDTKNTFPHSSGIASSASGMSALALGLMSIEESLNSDLSQDEFFQKASFLARIGSGSASRSLYGGLVQWGAHTDSLGSDLFGTAYEHPVHDVFKTYRDTVLLVDRGQKQVSSTVGHGLLKDHPFADTRYQLAGKNLSALRPVFASGDIDGFIDIVEREALMLHALMMTSNPYFILMKPNTLAIIEQIWAYRNESNIPVSFTLDAGANVHLLFPSDHEQKVFEFVDSELVGYCQNKQYICDHVGNGPQRLNND